MERDVLKDKGLTVTQRGKIEFYRIYDEDHELVGMATSLERAIELVEERGEE